MNLYLLSGFELDLFSKFEFPYVYWYLCEVVLNWQISTLSRIDSFLLSNELNFPCNLDIFSLFLTKSLRRIKEIPSILCDPFSFAQLNLYTENF